MKRILLLILFFTVSHVLIGQNDTGIVSFNEAFKIITDRNEYIAGEKVWFKLSSIVNAHEATSSKIAYIEIINPAGFSVSRKRVPLQIGNGFGELQLPDTLSTGIYKIMGYTNWMKNFEIPMYPENLIYIYNPEKPYDRKFNSLNSGFNEIKFSSADGKTLWQREFFISANDIELTIEGIEFNRIDKRRKVPISISSADINNEFETANLSIVVRKIPDPYYCNYDSIINSLLYYEHKPDLDQINNLLSFKKFTNQSNIKYLPEFKGALLSGKILNKEGIPLPDNDVFLSFPDSIVKVTISRTNDLGDFYFFVKQNMSIKEIVINANNHNQDLIILINSNFLNEYPAISQPKENNLNDEYKKYLDELYVNYRINQLYELNQSKSDSSYNFIKKSGFYQNAEHTFNLDNYVRLDSLHEYFYEIVPEVRIIKEKNERLLRVFNKKTNSLFEKNPALFIDGVYLEYPEYIFNLKPKDCKKIDIITSPVMLKNRVYDGLIAVFTYKSDLPITLQSNTSRIELNLFDKSDKFETSINCNQNIPYFRNTIYWNPDFILTKNASEKIEFYTGDDESWYEILIRGFTNNGKSVYARKTFKVSTTKIN